MAVGLMAAAMALRVLAAIGWRGLLTAFSCYGLVAAFVVFDLDRHAPHQRFGAANSVTLARAALTALLWGVVGETMLGERDLDQSLRWLLAVAATGALVLDGVDGWIARRNGMTSRFGADFDLEVDCLFMLALALLVYSTGQVGVSGPEQRANALPFCRCRLATPNAGSAPRAPAAAKSHLCRAGRGFDYSLGADLTAPSSRRRSASPAWPS